MIVEVAAAGQRRRPTRRSRPRTPRRVYADDGAGALTLPVRPLMVPNARWQFVLVYTLPEAAKAIAVEDVSAAAAEGAVGSARRPGCRCTTSR